jgi:hypothetical protein
VRGIAEAHAPGDGSKVVPPVPERPFHHLDSHPSQEHVEGDFIFFPEEATTAGRGNADFVRDLAERDRLAIALADELERSTDVRSQQGRSMWWPV